MKLTRGSTSDLISELPDNIIESILQYLPIQDVVRTSLLSSKWRYKWVTLPSLTFNDRDLRFSSNYFAVDKVYKVLNFIDRVLLLHVDPIEKFKLYISDDRANIDQYILFLSKHGIREFILDARCTYEVHSCLFSCKELSYLELHNCTFECLSANKGFNNLKRLHLEEITFRDEDQFESLISCSPLLEILILLDFDNVTHLKINAPNLKSLRLSGSFDSICFVNTLHLASVSIDLVVTDDNALVVEQGVSCNLMKFLRDLHNIEKLCIVNNFMEYLVMGNALESLPTICHHLKILKIGLGFDNLDEISAALCLMRSAPNLEELEITEYSCDVSILEDVFKFLELQNDLNFSLNQLRVIRMNEVTGLRCELGFIKLILSCSPVLETMSIIVAGKPEPTFAQELFRLQRASARAEILLEWM